MATSEGSRRSQALRDIGAWAQLHLWEIQPIRDVLLLAAIFGVLWAGYTASIVTVPLLLALALSYLFEPLVRRFSKGNLLRRRIAAGGIILGMLGLVVVPLTFGLIWALTSGFTMASEFQRDLVTLRRVVNQEMPPTAAELSDLPGDAWKEFALFLREPRDGDVAPAGEQPPDAGGPAPGEGDGVPGVSVGGAADEIGGVAGMVAAAPSVRGMLRAGAEWAWHWAEANQEQLKVQAAQKGRVALSALLRGTKSLGLIMFGGFLTAFFFFFVCTGYQRVLESMGEMIPDRTRPRAMQLLGRMDRVVAGFVRGRITICAILSVLFTVGYWIIGAPVPLVLGLVTGALSIVPYLAVVTIPVTITLMFVGATEGLRGEWLWILLAPIVLYYTIQSLDDYVLNPMIQGKHTDMDTPSILFASLAGAALLGIYGLLIAIPLAACIKILWIEVAMPRIAAWKKGRAADPLPIAGGG